MADLLYESQYFTTTLSVAGGINASQTTGIVLQNVSGVSEPTKPGLCLLSYSDPLDTTKAEWITYTSVNTTTKELHGVTRGQEGSSGKVHANGVTVAFPHSKSHINRINDKLTGVDSGVTLNSPTLTSPTLTSPTLNNPTITGTALASAEGLNVSSLYRQAIINGNFSVWQRGTSFTLTSNDYTVDRFRVYTSTASNSKQVSRQDAGLGGSIYCIRVQRTSGQTWTNPLVLQHALESTNSIPFRGQKMTLSFWARKGSDFSASSDLLVAKIVTGKGTDQKIESFTTSTDAASQSCTLTTSWQKFTTTTSSVIASDITQIGITLSYTPTGTASTNDYFEVAQVQLCAGEVALPFQPKSFEEELRACMRYWQQSYAIETTPGTVTNTGMIISAYNQGAATAGEIGMCVMLPVEPRIMSNSIVTTYSTITGNSSRIDRFLIGSGSTESSLVTVSTTSARSRFIVVSTGSSNANRISFHYTINAEL